MIAANLQPIPRTQVFWNVTLPNIRWGLMYGILLTNAVSATFFPGPPPSASPFLEQI